MPKKYEPAKQHDNHNCAIVYNENAYHKYEARCLDCDKHIKWSNKKEFEIYLKLENK